MNSAVNSSDFGNNISGLLSTKRQLSKQVIVPDKNHSLKKGIWLYFLLLIFEGALRKWVMPGLATPLLIVRDPVALWLLYHAWKRDLLPFEFSTVGLALIGIISLFTGFYFGHGNLYVALFGARIFLLHYPLMLVIGSVFTTEDVIKLGRFTLWIAIPMTFLIALQFYSPQSSWINKGIGGDTKGGGFTGVMGYFRPPGTFSFTTGVSQFFSFAGAFIIYFWYHSKEVKKFVLVVATLCLLAAIPLSISRTLFFSILVSIFFACLTMSRRPKLLWKTILIVIAVMFLFHLLGKLGAFQKAIEVFTARFDMANESGGGIKGAVVDRFFDGLISALENSSEQPFFGFGSGMGTNVGAMLLTGKYAFLIAEGEWGRLIGELGPLLGLLAILLRVYFCFRMAFTSYRRIQYGNILPWILLSFAFLMVLQGQWAQPTSLGFSIVSGGLVLAAIKTPDENRSIDATT